MDQCMITRNIVARTEIPPTPRLVFDKPYRLRSLRFRYTSLRPKIQNLFMHCPKGNGLSEAARPHVIDRMHGLHLASGSTLGANMLRFGNDVWGCFV